MKLLYFYPQKTEDRGPHSWWEDYSQNSDNNLLHDQQSSLFHLLQGTPWVLGGTLFSIIPLTDHWGNWQISA